MTEIRNTTADMTGPDSIDRLVFLLEGMSGRTDDFIASQERAGQQQLVASQMLPTDTCGTDADFLAAGFTFGEPVAGDPMFRPATLPAGWTKTGSDHDMWSYILDERGRQRVAIFYKAAFYNRSAHMRLATVAGYLQGHLYGDWDLESDDTWATPEAIVEAALKAAANLQEDVDRYTAWLSEEANGRAAHARKYLPETAERRAKCLAVVERFAPSVQDGA